MGHTLKEQRSCGSLVSDSGWKSQVVTYIWPSHDVDHGFRHLLQDRVIPDILRDLQVQGILNHRLVDVNECNAQSVQAGRTFDNRTADSPSAKDDEVFNRRYLVRGPITSLFDLRIHPALDRAEESS